MEFKPSERISLSPGMLFRVSDTGEIFILLNKYDFEHGGLAYIGWDILLGEKTTWRDRYWISQFGVLLSGHPNEA